MKITVHNVILDCDESKAYSSRIILSYSGKHPLYFMQVAWITHSLLDAKIFEISLIPAELLPFSSQISLPW